MCCLAVGNLPPGGSSLETQVTLYWDESPGGHERPARRFLENFQKPKILRNKQSMCVQFNIHFMQSFLNLKLTIKTPLTWFPLLNFDT